MSPPAQLEPVKPVSLAREHFGPPFLFKLSPPAQFEPAKLVSLSRDHFGLPFLFLLSPPAQMKPAKPMNLAREHFGPPFSFSIVAPSSLNFAVGPWEQLGPFRRWEIYYILYYIYRCPYEVHTIRRDTPYV